MNKNNNIGVIHDSYNKYTSTCNNNVQYNKYPHVITVSRVLEYPCKASTNTYKNCDRVTVIQHMVFRNIL